MWKPWQLSKQGIKTSQFTSEICQSHSVTSCTASLFLSDLTGWCFRCRPGGGPGPRGIREPGLLLDLHLWQTDMELCWSYSHRHSGISPLSIILICVHKLIVNPNLSFTFFTSSVRIPFFSLLTSLCIFLYCLSKRNKNRIKEHFIDSNDYFVHFPFDSPHHWYC